MKPFNIKDSLAGKPVKLRNGRKAYVRHHETELPVDEDMRLMGFLPDGSMMSWRVDGYYYSPKYPSEGDIIGMYPETRTINGFEVPAPETEEPKFREEYFISAILNRGFYERCQWHNLKCEYFLLECGLVFSNKEDAIATAKAVLGIDPNSED